MAAHTLCKVEEEVFEALVHFGGCTVVLGADGGCVRLGFL